METKKDIRDLINNLREAIDKKLIDTFYLTERIHDNFGLISITLKHTTPNIEKESLRTTLKESITQTYSGVEVEPSVDNINIIRIFYRR